MSATVDDKISLLREVEQLTAHTDASQKDWGFTIKSSEQWIISEAKIFPANTVTWHANRREYFALCQTIVRIDAYLRVLPAVRHITVHSDSKVTVANADAFDRETLRVENER